MIFQFQFHGSLEFSSRLDHFRRAKNRTDRVTTKPAISLNFHITE